jgi:hypothetical protein
MHSSQLGKLSLESKETHILRCSRESSKGESICGMAELGWPNWDVRSRARAGKTHLRTTTTRNMQFLSPIADGLWRTGVLQSVSCLTSWVTWTRGKGDITGRGEGLAAANQKGQPESVKQEAPRTRPRSRPRTEQSIDCYFALLLVAGPYCRLFILIASECFLLLGSVLLRIAVLLLID